MSAVSSVNGALPPYCLCCFRSFCRYYLSSRYTALKVRTDQARPIAEKNILSKGFEFYCQQQSPPLTSSSGTSVARWLGSFHGIGSDLGHTTLHPHKTDACDECTRFETDISSAEMSLKRHSQQADQTPGRVAAVAETKVALQDLRTAQAEHLEEAEEAKAAYKAAYEAASHERYAKLTDEFNALPRDGGFHPDGSINTESERGKELLRFAKSASYLKVPLDSDFQQDKHYPQWNLLPQPGPT